MRVFQKTSEHGSHRASGPRIVHLDHTTAKGGAELALVRLLRAQQAWEAGVLYPAAEQDDVFAQLPPSTSRWVRGVRQTAGGSSGGATTAINVALRMIGQAIVTRLHPAVRGSDLVAANSTRSAAYGALALRTSRKPFVVHLRDIIASESLGALGHLMMTRVILPRADGVIANSRSTLATAEPYLRPHAVRAVIPSASGLQVRSHERSSDGPLRVGILARVDPWKGQKEVIQAFAQAFPHDDAVLEIAGAALFKHESYAAELTDLVRDLGLTDRVTFLGHVEDVDTLLSRWDIGVQASQRPEPLGQNVLQYLAAGLATVVAGEGGPAEWVDHEKNGLVVAPRDVGALAAALRRLADDPTLRKRLASVATRTPGLLDDVSIAESHARTYADVLARCA